MLGICARSVGVTVGGGLAVWVGEQLADVYMEILGGRCRPNTVRTAAYDLKAFFTVVAKSPEQAR